MELTQINAPEPSVNINLSLTELIDIIRIIRSTAPTVTKPRQDYFLNELIGIKENILKEYIKQTERVEIK